MPARSAPFLCALFLVLAGPVSAPAQENPLYTRGPQLVSRLPVVRARHGMVVSKESHATRIGLDILRRGGNAIDAAVATGFALAVTSPRSAALGGGGFMLVYLAKEKRVVALDYRETAPADTRPDVFLDANGKPDPVKSRETGLAVGVPGTVAGLVHAWRRWGSGRFTLAQLVAPAVALARNGIPVADDLQDSLAEDSQRLSHFPESRRIFFRDGAPLQGGDTLVQSDLARTIEAIGRDGDKAFYTGPLAHEIAQSVRAAGGHMSAADLARYKVVERDPVRGTYRGHEIVSMPPPSSGGVHVIEILNMIEGFPMASYGADSAEGVHLMTEAMKRAFADRAAWLGDPDFVHVPVAGLTSKAYAAALRRQISPDRATPAAEIAPGRPQPYESDQTTHFSVVDSEGNAVANTYTLNFSFGVGLVATGTGVLLNDELDDFTAKAGAANTYGLVGEGANLPGPDKRPVSSMSPTMVFRDGRLEYVLGTPGGPRIITTVVELLSDLIDDHMSIADAVAEPRFHDQWMPDRLALEPGFSPDTIRLLKDKGQNLVVQNGWGAAAVIARTPDGILLGAADPRQRGTLAAGY